MRFAGLFSFLSLVASVLAGRYIVILRPSASLDRFLAKLEKGGNIWVVRKYESPSYFNGAVVTTNDYNETTLLEFPEVIIAEEDKMMTIDPIPAQPGPDVPSPTEPTLHLPQ
ncbi:hypothetical protein CkaCkLH20_10751 [Colletotrichum karsti]|uniref:Uncharacterized protein n=1 Tax=Colletotrichum karsti TaxID=1095194 RepID=A0A9P6LGU7_9PEZI|nr:uncharacterized protein CkaCkLH20_10751 [Colletotrichum karsti]KAF9871817.1 hypothetical protein CkaCkLH20_10751 [Colletotrichum karsti]